MNICAITSLLFASSVTLIVAQTNYLSFVTEPVQGDYFITGFSGWYQPTNAVDTNLSARGTITANGYYFPTNATCQLVISNGLSGIWNSNGVATYLRYSAVGSTAFTDKQLAP